MLLVVRLVRARAVFAASGISTNAKLRIARFLAELLGAQQAGETRAWVSIGEEPICDLPLTYRATDELGAGVLAVSRSKRRPKTAHNETVPPVHP